MKPWSPVQINQARQVAVPNVLQFLGAHYKRDVDYVPSDSARQSVRVHVGYQGRDFRFIFTGDKWINELLPSGTPNRGGGGAIDFVRHITGVNFVQAVKVCLDTIESMRR
jgi:hypothetical protein